MPPSQISTSDPAAIGRPKRPVRREPIGVEALETRLLLASGAATSSQFRVASLPRTKVELSAKPSLTTPTIVSDSAASRGGSTTVQNVHAASDVLIEGSSADSSAPDMYRVSLGSDTRAVIVNLSSPEGSPTVTIRLWVFDDSGKLLGNFPLDSSIDLSVIIRPLDPSAGGSIFVAVSQDGAGSAEDPGLYMLRILWTGEPGMGSIADDSSRIILAASAPILPSAGSPGGAFGVASAAGAISATIDAAISSGSGQGSALSSLPIRSAGASGGLFGDGGEVAPPIDLAADAVDRALFELGSSGGVAESGSGFLAILDNSQGEVSEARPGEADRGEPSVIQSISRKPTSPEIATRTSDEPGNDDEIPADRMGRMAVIVPVAAGFTVAGLLGLGLVLPEVASAVEALRRRPRRRGRRPRSPATV